MVYFAEMKPLHVALFLFAFHFSAYSQNCTSGLGAQIINYTFGTTAVNPGAALAPGITDLQYTTAPCPPDGSYTIVNQTNGCFGNGWVTMNDHTGNTNGCFMLVNASLQPNTFYTDTISNLCEGVTYEFGAWVINVVAVTGNYIEPNLTFLVRSTNGTVLQSNNTGDIPMSGTQWNYYSFFFTVPAGNSSVVFSIRNNAPGGSGNDLALDDISLRPVGPGIDVGIQGYPTDTVSFCGVIPPLTLTSQVDSCYPITVYQWLQSSDNGITWVDVPGATSPTYSPNTTGSASYLYRLAASNPGNISNEQCRVLSSVIAIYYTQAPPITATPSDTAVCAGSTVTFNVSGGSNYQWSNGTIGAQNTVTVNAPSFYVVSATSSTPNCISTDTVFTHIHNSTIMVTPQDTTVCAGNMVTFMASGGSSYQWSNGVQTAQNTVTATSNNSYIVTAIAQGTGCIVSDTVLLNVETANANITPNDTIVCAGNTVTFTATGGNSYQWSNGAQGAQNNVTVNASGYYVVTVTPLGAGCSATDTAYASVYAPTVVSINNQTVGICGSDTAVLTATGGVSYIWSTLATTTSISIYPITNATYSVTATDLNGCTASASASTVPSISWSILVDTVQPPCPNVDMGSITLTANGNTTPLKYTWNTGDSTGQISMLAPGIYNVTVSDDSACQVQLSIVLDYEYTLEVEILPQDISVVEGTKVLLQSTVNVDNANQYTWLPPTYLSCNTCANTIANVPKGDYEYILVVSDQNGCVATDTTHINAYVVPVVFIPSAFSPNGDGNNDYFQIWGSDDLSKYVNYFSVKIFDRWGEKVYESSDVGFKWNGVYKNTMLPPGVYVYLVNYTMAGDDMGQQKKGSLTLIR